MPKVLPPDHTETEIYRRHLSDCKKPKRCQCPLWIYGYIHGERVRESLKTNRMDVAVDRQKRREGRGEAVEPARSDCTIQDAINKYLKWVELNGTLPATIQEYRYGFKHLSAFCAVRKVHSVRGISKSLMADFVLSFAKFGVRTRVVHFRKLRSLFGYLRDSDFMDIDPLPRRGPREPREGSHRPLDEEEQQRLLEGCRTQEEHALILLMLATGLRGVDVRDLRWTNLDLKQRVLRLTPKKTKETSGNEVIVPALPANLMTILRLVSRSSDSDWVFPQWRRRRIYFYVLSEIMSRAGVKATGHDLRCTFAVERLHEGASIYDVSLLLGHTNVKTTQRYYAKWENKQALTERLSGVMEKGRFSHLQKAS